jgi:hypothetical protein
MSDPKTGSCLCGAVRYSVAGPLRPVVYCHCTQCRKQTGHFVAATAAADADLTVTGEGSITWFAASPIARRGFCKSCGSLLFWKSNVSTRTSIMAGSMDKPSGLKARAHIFCADAGDYYEIKDDLPHYPAAD